MIGSNPISRFSVSSSWEGTQGTKFDKYFDGYMLIQIIKKYPDYAAYIFPKSDRITAGLFTSRKSNPEKLKAMWNDFVEFWEIDNEIKPKYAFIPL